MLLCGAGGTYTSRRSAVARAGFRSDSSGGRRHQSHRVDFARLVIRRCFVVRKFFSLVVGHPVVPTRLRPADLILPV